MADGDGPNAAELTELRERLRRELKLGTKDVLEMQPAELLMPESSGKFLLGYPQMRTAE